MSILFFPREKIDKYVLYLVSILQLEADRSNAIGSFAPLEEFEMNVNLRAHRSERETKPMEAPGKSLSLRLKCFIFLYL